MGIYAEDSEKQFSWNENVSGCPGQTARQHQFGHMLDTSHSTLAAAAIVDVQAKPLVAQCRD